MYWQTSRRKISLEQPLVMGILNVTPDSFSDGGEFLSIDNALRHAEAMIADGANIIDVGGESTRPGSGQVSADDEIKRVVPVIEAITKRFDTPVSIDTTKSEVAVAAVNAGAEIINDISGLRFDVGIADVAARTNAGLVLMHSRGDFASMHTQSPIDDVFAAIIVGLNRSIDIATARGVRSEQIAVDVGIGFGKTQEQNLELLAKLDKIVSEFKAYPMLIGTSRKSFLTRILGDVPPAERRGGSLATALVAIRNGAKILRVHDVRETVSAIKTAAAISGVK
ncbi:MAG TPA: dihydropteroate synthase [Pyrinomonadaceae bacterium]|nr:dihydropteroate synthase [Pyrinomonadaceae bacterium]